MPRIEAPQNRSIPSQTLSRRVIDFVPKSSPSKKPLSAARPTTFPSYSKQSHRIKRTPNYPTYSSPRIQPQPKPKSEPKPQTTTSQKSPKKSLRKTLFKNPFLRTAQDQNLHKVPLSAARPTKRPQYHPDHQSPLPSKPSRPTPSPTPPKPKIKPSKPSLERKKAMNFDLEPEPLESIETIENIEFDLIEEYQPSAHPSHNQSIRSPFLTSVDVPKRPLSARRTEQINTTKKTSIKKQSSKLTKLAPSDIVKPESRKSKLPMIILIVATVIVGAVIGGAVYLFFFKN